MRHHNTNRKFGRIRKVRKGLVRSLVFNLLLKEKIKTTLPKAKEIRPIVEKLITKSKNNTVANRRYLTSYFGNEKITKKIFDKISTKFSERKGGYTRVLKLENRKSDGSKMAIIEFV